MEEMLQELAASKPLRKFLESRVPTGPDAPGCAPTCSWILEDLKLNNKLTGHPRDSVGQSLYSVPSKIMHLYLELVGGRPPKRQDDALRAIVEKLRTL